MLCYLCLLSSLRQSPARRLSLGAGSSKSLSIRKHYFLPFHVLSMMSTCIRKLYFLFIYIVLYIYFMKYYKYYIKLQDNSSQSTIKCYEIQKNIRITNVLIFEFWYSNVFGLFFDTYTFVPPLPRFLVLSYNCTCSRALSLILIWYVYALQLAHHYLHASFSFSLFILPQV